MSDVGYDIVKWQKWWLWSIRLKIRLHKCQSEVGTQSDFFWWSGYPVRFFLVKWVPSVRFFWWSGYKVPIWHWWSGYKVQIWQGEVGTRWVSDSITSHRRKNLSRIKSKLANLMSQFPSNFKYILIIIKWFYLPFLKYAFVFRKLKISIQSRDKDRFFLSLNKRIYA